MLWICVLLWECCTALPRSIKGGGMDRPVRLSSPYLPVTYMAPDESDARDWEPVQPEPVEPEPVDYAQPEEEYAGTPVDYAQPEEEYSEYAGSPPWEQVPHTKTLSPAASLPSLLHESYNNYISDRRMFSNTRYAAGDEAWTLGEEGWFPEEEDMS